MDYLSLLPDELFTEIFVYLNYDQLSENKSYFEVLSKDYFWWHKIIHDFPNFNLNEEIIHLPIKQILNKFPEIRNIELTDLVLFRNYSKFDQIRPLIRQYGSSNINELIYYIRKINSFNGLYPVIAYPTIVYPETDAPGVFMIGQSSHSRTTLILHECSKMVSTYNNVVNISERLGIEVPEYLKLSVSKDLIQRYRIFQRSRPLSRESINDVCDRLYNYFKNNNAIFIEEQK